MFSNFVAKKHISFLNKITLWHLHQISSMLLCSSWARTLLSIVCLAKKA